MNCSVVTNFNTPVVVINFVHPSICSAPLSSAAGSKSDQLLTTRLLTIKRQCLQYVYRIRKYVIFSDFPVPSRSYAGKGGRWGGGYWVQGKNNLGDDIYYSITSKSRLARWLICSLVRSVFPEPELLRWRPAWSTVRQAGCSKPRPSTNYGPPINVWCIPAVYLYQRRRGRSGNLHSSGGNGAMQ